MGESSGSGAGAGAGAGTAPSRPLPSLVSVVIPVFNGGPLFDRQLAALAAQDYAGAWELLVADNGSTDDTRATASAWAARFPVPLRIIDASTRQGCPAARNIGSSAAAGDFLVYCDADDEVEPGWLSAMAAAAPGAGIVGGWLDGAALNDGLLQGWRPGWSRTELPMSHGWLPYATGANLGVWSEVFHDLGGFREHFVTGDDVEFCWRAQLAGEAIVLAPDAVVRYRYRESLAQMARQFRTYGQSDVLLFREFHRHGVRRRSLRDGLFSLLWLLKHLPDLRHLETRGFWVREAALEWGRIRGSVAHRRLYL